MIYLTGGKAFTTYRQNQLLQRLQHLFPAIIKIEAYYVYFVEAKTLLNKKVLTQLQALLPNAVVSEFPVMTSDFACWVVPRLGTISPWSSKATHIARICGLDDVERVERGIYYKVYGIVQDNSSLLVKELYDPLTENVLFTQHDLANLFLHSTPSPMMVLPLLEKGIEILKEANQNLGLALSDLEINYLYEIYKKLKRNPTDVELMMFGQVNSEHCRHKIFNAHWNIDGHEKNLSLFGMIRNTYQKNPHAVLVAYKDNAAVMHGFEVERLYIDPLTHQYEKRIEITPYVLKVETHNHPTAISPFPGAATGSGGEIRDEAATGRGAQAKAGLCGFSVSHLRIPNLIQPWENSIGKPEHIASALQIMLDGPIGAASFNNEFGRPNICGYFRTCEIALPSPYGEVWRGYHKPIMIAGGIGNIRDMNVFKKDLISGNPVIVLGGPAMKIGLGGGSASSRQNAQNQELDFASVQRSNPEMQRRAQEVINTCIALGEDNPIISIHDVGAGGLSNAIPELVHGSNLGGKFALRAIPTAEPGMSPLELWCNEAQERYVLSIKAESIEQFTEIANRERCPFAIVGEAIEESILEIEDAYFENRPIDLPMNALFESMPAMQRQDQHAAPIHENFDISQINLADAIQRVLQFPCVSSKNFLVTIGDRSVGGLIARDQMVGPWQIPVADCGVTCNSFSGYQGEAMAMGERPPIALLHPAASARMAVGEAITNIAAAAIENISDIVLSANWMAAADYPSEGAGLYDAVQTIALELCPSLGIAIPVGKDSLSMRMTWEQGQQHKSVTAPLSLIITAAAKVYDVRLTSTPELKKEAGPTQLILIDLGKGANLLGASALSQTYKTLFDRPPDVDDPALLRNFFQTIQLLRKSQLLLAYHDRSDGGLLATLCEMMFASHCGLTIKIDDLGSSPIAILFAEELGAVIQIKSSDLKQVQNILKENGLEDYSHVIGEINTTDELQIYFSNQILYQESRTQLQRWWSETSYHMQALRDNADCARQEFQHILQTDDPGLNVKVNFDFNSAPYIHKGIKPKIAILREQGVNGHMEMAAAFTYAGFNCVDVHMSDLISGRVQLNDFKGLAACGGFSYGDVLGAGRGWAQSILMHPGVRQEFENFFNRDNAFTLGVCNGCQMLAELQEIIPGTAHWPRFTRNISEQYEARLTLVEVPPSPSILLKNMAGSVIPVVVAHGEGYANFPRDNINYVRKHHLIALRYVDNQHQITEQYPFNPNGSPAGIAALTNDDGRVTIMMPHPERVHRTVQFSWHPSEWGEMSPWIKLFTNAREWVG